MDDLVEEKSELMTQITSLREELIQSRKELLMNSAQQTIIPDSNNVQTSRSSILENNENDSGVGLSDNSDSLLNGQQYNDMGGNHVVDERNEVETPQVTIYRMLSYIKFYFSYSKWILQYISK